MRRQRQNQRLFAFRLAGCVAACLLFSACGPNKRYDLIEAELRTRDRELEETRVALEQSRNLNRAYAQQSQFGSGPIVPNTPVYIPIKEIVLARGTGGVNEDGVPGDEGLMLVIVPKDEDGSPVKVPGKVQIAAWEVSEAGLKNSIGVWEVPAEKVRPTWRGGFISSGFFVAVPWQTQPGSERVRVAVRFTTLDGRAFEADRDINVQLATGQSCPPTPAVQGVAVPTPTVPGMAVPTPTVPTQPGVREPLLPDPIPPGTEELPPPSTSQRGARLLPPEKS